MGMGSNLLLGSVNENDQWVPNKVTGKQLEGRKLIDASVSGQHSALLVIYASVGGALLDPRSGS